MIHRMGSSFIPFRIEELVTGATIPTWWVSRRQWGREPRKFPGSIFTQPDECVHLLMDETLRDRDLLTVAHIFILA